MFNKYEIDFEKDNSNKYSILSEKKYRVIEKVGSGSSSFHDFT